MHPFIFARTQPNRPSVTMAESDEAIRNRDLEALGVTPNLDQMEELSFMPNPIEQVKVPTLPSDQQRKAACSTN